MVFGYTRMNAGVTDKNKHLLDDQLQILYSAGATEIFVDEYVNIKKSRSELDKLTSLICSGDRGSI